MTDTSSIATAELRLAAYVEQTERLDFRTSGIKQCKPPNRKCGDRCIPPNWDCRLRGEGNDPHLKAAGKGSDPIGGFANIERGFQKLGRSVTKLSPSELDSSRRSFARGAAKLHPGDLKQKEEVKEKVFQVATWVGTPVLIGIFAGLTHTGLKANKSYREGPGRQVDTAVGDAVYNMQRNAPFTGERMQQREAAARAAFRNLQTTRRVISVGDPRVLARRSTPPANFLASTARRQAAGGTSMRSGAAAVRANLASVDLGVNSSKPSRMSYAEWAPKSVQAFWQTKLPMELQNPLTGGPSTNIFAVGSTNNLLSVSYGMPKPPRFGADLVKDTNQVVRHMTRQLSANRAAMLADMKQRGWDPATDVDRYLDLNSKSWRTGDEVVDTQVKASIQNLLQTPSVRNYAESQYISTREAYSNYFDKISLDLSNPPDISNRGLTPEDRTRARSLYPDGLQGHANGLVGLTNMGWTSNKAIKTPAMAELVRRAYHARIVMGQKSPLISVSSKTTLISIANELEPGVQHNVASATERVSAFLREMGFAGITYASGQRRGDSVAYLAALTETAERLDKRCGKSGIPDNMKCHQPTTAAPVAAKSGTPPRASRPGGSPRPGAPRPGGSPPRAPKPGAKPTKKEEPSTLQRVATGAAVVGAVAGGVAAVKNRKAISTNVNKAVKTTKKAVGFVKSENTRFQQIKEKNRSVKNSYGGQKYTEQGLDRVSRDQFLQAYRDKIPQLSEAAVKRLSDADIRTGLDKLPKQFQEPARNLVGFAKKFAVVSSMEAQGAKMVGVNNEHNFATYIDPKTGYVSSIGSVGDSVLIYGSERKGAVKGVPKYGMAFTVDLTFAQRKGLAREQSLGVAKATKAMFNDQIERLPDNAFITNTPYSDDGLGKKRAAIYKKWGFTQLPGKEEMWAMKDGGKFRKISKEEMTALDDILRGRKDSASKSSFPVLCKS